MKKFIVMRGCPGSGKSTEAQVVIAEAQARGLTTALCSTDSYFLISDGKGGHTYAFDRDKIPEFHQANQDAARAAIAQGVNVIVIDNTNSHSWEMRPYIEMACYGEYQIEFREPTAPWWLEVRPRIGETKDRREIDALAARFKARTIHGVPEQAIARMLARWENLDQLDSDIRDLVALANSVNQNAPAGGVR